MRDIIARFTIRVLLIAMMVAGLIYENIGSQRLITFYAICALGVLLTCWGIIAAFKDPEVVIDFAEHMKKHKPGFTRKWFDRTFTTMLIFGCVYRGMLVTAVVLTMTWFASLLTSGFCDKVLEKKSELRKAA
jgi:hypothetical protein